MSISKAASSTSSSRRFALGFAVTVAALLVTAAVATELLVRRQIEPHHNYLKYLRLFKSTQARDAAFGSSITVGGFTGQPGFVNMGFGGEPLNFIVHKLKMFYADRKPGRVILQGSFMEFSDSFWTQLNRDNTDEFESMMSADDPTRLRILNPMHRASLLLYWRTMLADGGFEPSAKFQPDGSRLNSERYSDQPADVRAMAARQTARSWRLPQNPEKSPAATVMADAIRHVRAKGGEVCIVSYPVTASLYRELLKSPNFDRIPAALAHIADTEGARYVNMLDHGMPDEYFVDDVHINGDGARAISPEIVSRCFGS
ncbi:MAG TPA: hypothetical protein VLL76_02645 [Candidatus Omnitrophota bacterium]|nr:hypothetical protein [Candidatus Omnitrophota bacterium]